MEHPHNTSRAEAERLLGISEKLLLNRDLNGSREFALLAQEAEPLLDGPDQILAVTQVLLAADKRINNHHDWYAILQLERRSDDLELIKKQFRRLAFLLHPDKNRYAFSDTAFKLVADAWAALSDSKKKFLFDNELGLYSKIDLVATKKQREFQKQQPPPPKQRQKDQDHQTFPVRRGSPPASTGGEKETSSFWTACPYCYNLYEYPRDYEGCCLRCQNCERAFSAVAIPEMPPLVPGKEAYNCCWGFFPMGFTVSGSEVGKSGGFPVWVPPTFSTGGTATTEPAVWPSGGNGGGFVNVAEVNVTPAGTMAKKKRGRPRKVVQV
ncbi:unnamed protein product [Ilex paraguariensis]|uniref:J domain-containing protein n=1 Tax=Ilex paraguariensis TaxID=185542 RepID=A0ABC8UZT8_9AQUA